MTPKTLAEHARDPGFRPTHLVARRTAQMVLPEGWHASELQECRSLLWWQDKRCYVVYRLTVEDR